MRSVVAPRHLLVVAILCATFLAACGGTPASGTPGTPGDSVMSPEAAVALVVADHPEFEGVGPFDPDLIGGCCWYTAAPVEGGYEVTFRMGWGDCPAGCIDEHLWTYRVGADGRVELVDERGDPVPPGGVPGIGGS